MMGKHYLLQLYGVDYDKLDNESYLCSLIELAAETSGATVIQTISKSLIRMVSLLSLFFHESHISIHTWQTLEAAVDIFTCGKCDPKIGCDVMIQQLQPEDHTLSYIER